MRDLRVDLYDPAVATLSHAGQHLGTEQNRALHEEIQLGEMLSPGHVGKLGLRLWTGRVEHQHVDRTQHVRDSRHQAGDL